MNKIHINKNQFSDLINLFGYVFFPLKNFVSRDEFLQIVDIKKYKNDLDYKNSMDNAARTIEICNPIRNLPQNKFDMLRKINIEIGQ